MLIQVHHGGRGRLGHRAHPAVAEGRVNDIDSVQSQGVIQQTVSDRNVKSPTAIHMTAQIKTTGQRGNRGDPAPSHVELVSKFDVDGVKAVAVSVIPFKFKNVNQKHVIVQPLIGMNGRAGRAALEVAIMGLKEEFDAVRMALRVRAKKVNHQCATPSRVRPRQTLCGKNGPHVQPLVVPVFGDENDRVNIHQQSVDDLNWKNRNNVILARHVVIGQFGGLGEVVRCHAV